MTPTSIFCIDKACQLYEPEFRKELGTRTPIAVQVIHKHVFDGVFESAGQLRTKNKSKGNLRFVSAFYLSEVLEVLERTSDSTFEEIIAKYVEMYVAHPFSHGSEAALRIWLDHLLIIRISKRVKWELVDNNQYTQAIERGPVNDLELRTLLFQSLTGDLSDTGAIRVSVSHSLSSME